MDRVDVRIGVPVRLGSDYLDVPRGTLATVETAGLFRDETWCFTVRWHNLTLSRQRKYHYPCSLNLWEKDLELFEVATAEECAAAASLVPRPSKKWASALRPLPPSDQLTLPFQDA
jgi:hypothetical protein